MKLLVKIILSLLYFVFISGVHALPNDTYVSWSDSDVIENLQSYSILNGQPYWSSRHYLYVNGEIAYCIQRGVDITTRTYSSETDFNYIGINDEIKKRLELISTFGYTYLDYNPLTYLATQQMIWEELGHKVTWHDGKNLNAIYDTNSIINAINNNINLFLKKPSFNGNTYQGNVGDYITIEDLENVVSRFSFSIPNPYFNINNNKITVRITKLGLQEIGLKQGEQLLKTPKIYTAFNSQNLMTIGLSFINYANLYLKGNSLLIKINKKDIDTNELIENETIEYKIIDLLNNVYLKFDNNEIITVKGGSFILKTPLKPGKYKLEEVSTTGNYTINKDGLYFEINDENNIICNQDLCYTELNFYNKKILGQIKIIKTGDILINNNERIIYDNIPLENIEFGIYDNSNNLLEIIKTNKDGIALSNMLELGSYKVKELKSLDKYELDDEEYNVILDPNDQKNAFITKELKLNNKLKKGTLNVLKIDIDSKKSLNNAIFKIYDENEFLTFIETTNNGSNNIELPVGTYYIQEIKAPNGYFIDDEVKEVNILNNSTAYFVGEDLKEITILPKTGINSDTYKIRLAGIFILFITSILSIKSLNE